MKGDVPAIGHNNLGEEVPPLQERVEKQACAVIIAEVARYGIQALEKLIDDLEERPSLLIEYTDTDGVPLLHGQEEGTTIEIFVGTHKTLRSRHYFQRNEQPAQIGIEYTGDAQGLRIAQKGTYGA